MRIGIDARFYSEAGIGRYIKNLLYYLQKLDVENEYFVLLLKKDFDILHFKSKNFQTVLADVGWYGVAEQVQLPNLLYSLKLDLVHFPHFNIPIFYKGKFVVTIHDLIHQKYKMRRATTHDPFTYWVKHNAYNLAFWTALKRSQKVITVSDYVEQELINQWHVPKDKLLVTKEGVEEKIIILAASLSENNRKKVLEKFGIKGTFLFYVGNAHPHKNVEGLIKAFLQLKGHRNSDRPLSLTLPQTTRMSTGHPPGGGNQTHDQKNTSVQLVLSGGGHYFWERIKEEYNHEDIIYTGYVSDEELIALYSSCRVYVVPSFEEGFGIPLLEAMACGAPVASSNRASLPEVGGNAALYFDPNNIDDMAEKISTLLNLEIMRKDLIKKGYERVKEFSWEKMVKQTLEVYNT